MQMDSNARPSDASADSFFGPTEDRSVGDGATAGLGPAHGEGRPQRKSSGAPLGVECKPSGRPTAQIGAPSAVLEASAVSEESVAPGTSRDAMRSASPRVPRVLIVSSIPLDPPTHGNRARNRTLVGALRRAGIEVHYLFWSTSSDEQYPAEAMRALVDSGELIRARAPRPIRNAQRLARNVAHLLGGRGMLPAAAWWALSADRLASTLCPPALLARVRALLATQRFDAVLASYANLGPVAALAREHGALAIIDTHDILHERAEAIRTHRIFPSGTIIGRAAEARMLAQADLLLAIQSREARELAPLVGASRVMLVEHGFDMPPLVPMRTAGRRALTIVASDNKQNEHGLVWFLDEVWPGILARVPDAVLEVHGPLSLRAECRGPRVEARGIAAELAPVYRDATVCINPIRAGSGLKIKSVETMAHARALVSTSVGADGLLPSMEDGLRVADEPGAFADACVELLLDPSRAAALGVRAREACARRFSSDVVFAPLIARIRDRQQRRGDGRGDDRGDGRGAGPGSGREGSGSRAGAEASHATRDATCDATRTSVADSAATTPLDPITS